MAYKAAWAVAEHYVHVANNVEHYHGPNHAYDTHVDNGPDDPRHEDRPTERDVIEKMITIMQDPTQNHPGYYEAD
jgi:hypothetical protein